MGSWLRKNIAIYVTINTFIWVLLISGYFSLKKSDRQKADMIIEQYYEFERLKFQRVQDSILISQEKEVLLQMDSKLDTMIFELKSQ